MKQNNPIRSAIDESLGSVHFNAGDMRSVLRAVREQRQEAPYRRAPSARRHARLDFALAMATVLVVAVPLSVFALRAHRAQTADIKVIIAASGAPGPAAQGTGDDPLPTPGTDRLPTPLPTEDAGAVSASPDARTIAGFTESDAIQAARACFEAQCDTEIFSFEEYTVSAAPVLSDHGGSGYVVTMESVYDNGCAFQVTVSAPDGQIVAYSAPALATMPSRLNRESEEVQAWYDKYGPYSFTWPMEAQAEFSRRYEGAMLRMPREGEVGEDDIAARVGLQLSDLAELSADRSVTYCIALYSERAFADGRARYKVYCFPGKDVSQALPETGLILTYLAADGTLESEETLSTAGL